VKLKPFSQFLREARIWQEVTQGEVANALKLKPQQISNVERGEAPLAEKHFSKLAKVLGISLEMVVCAAVDDYALRLQKRFKLR